MAILHVNSNSFDKLLEQADRPVLVDFWAPWCGPCRMLGPILEEVSNEHENEVIVAKVNIDEEMDLAARFGIASIPTMLVFNQGKMVNRAVGLQPKATIEGLWK